MKINFDLIISSPLKRSLQTATLIGTETGYEAPVMQSPGLTPEAKLSDFQKLMREFSSRENVLVVGHNPNLQDFLGSLMVPSGATPAQIRLRKGTIARLSLTRGPASLQGLMDPRVIRALYATSIKSSRRKTAKK